MADVGGVIAAVEIVAHEAALFAAVGFLIGGIDDLAIDLVYFLRAALRGRRRRPDPDLADFTAQAPLRRFAVLVPAWDEAAVIGGMLRTALARLDHPDYRILVGAYPNDRATIDLVAQIAAGDPRVLLVVHHRDGPTTKADCLNQLWHALARDDARHGRRTDAVVLHDAEDVVHTGELRIFDALLGSADVVQLPVLPLVDRTSRLVSGHYIDEFAEAHGKQMLVRQALRAGLPLAGTGCAIRRDMLDRVAAARGGDPFDATSLTEDYELGLTIAAMGGRGRFARVLEAAGGRPVAIRAYFPATIDAAVRQKARWMTGIALAGWDRIGWGRAHQLTDHWMRMRDRRALLAVILLASAYCSLVLWAVSAGAGWFAGRPGTVLAPWFWWLLVANAGLLLWRLALRAAFVGMLYGRGEALLSVPRMVVGNAITLLAARRAVFRYVASLRGRELRWDKTSHHFPAGVDPAG
ncbi:adsorption protein B [Sphingomonas japonica]|uniref:Adsorption protein B n=1 Tax=Sphingomonas japonica TaxID=511662 RepID=A0ABX0TYS7_9SPHN|nr:adsorption protein B [Sphingomonas japonica]